MKMRTKLIGDFRDKLKCEGFVDITCYFEIKPKKFMIGCEQVVNMETSNLVPIDKDGGVVLKRGGKKYYYGQILLDQRKYIFENRSPYSMDWDDLDTIKKNLLSKGFVPLDCISEIDPTKYFVNDKGIVLNVKGKNIGDEPVREAGDEDTCFYRLTHGDGDYRYYSNKELAKMQFEQQEV